MKKRKTILCVLLLICILSLSLVACDKDDAGQVVYVELVQKDMQVREPDSAGLQRRTYYWGQQYIKVWYDEAWFPKFVYIDIYDASGETLLESPKALYDALYNPASNNHWGIISPNTYMYIDLTGGSSLTEDNDELIIKVKYLEHEGNDIYKEVILAIYTISNIQHLPPVEWV